MELKAFRHLWGYPIASPETFRKIREAGYAGIETGMLGIDDPQGFLDGLKAHGLEYIGQVYTAGFTKGHSVAEHLAHLETEVRKLLPLGPAMINVHSGEDTWPMDDMHAYFCGAAELEKKLGVPFAHETHRGRCLFHPTVARIMLESHPEIKLVADLSHWVCVCERLLEDQQEIIALAADRTIHVHCRMGHAEAPQVTDPRGDNYAAERKAFEGWWQLIHRSMQRRGLPAFSFCPEYGPPPYMPTLPYTAMPVADLEEICNWQAERIRELVSQWQAS
ncbi:MAG: sugar phosphate isomerase/epimerase [Pirellulales bacterium]|nr:sugar phosphate isomerase/epimerase [Pirellulales bacterium]